MTDTGSPEKNMVPTQVYSIYINSTPEQIWEAITKPEWTEKYMYNSLVEYDLKPGGKYVSYPGQGVIEGSKAMGFPVPETMTDGEVIEVDAPNKLVQTWRLTMDPQMIAEGFTRLTWQLREIKPKLTKLTVTHELEGAPNLALLVSGEWEEQNQGQGGGGGGGWNQILSGLKTLLETGEALSFD